MAAVPYFTNSGADRGTLLDLAVDRLEKEASTAANRAKRRRVDTPEGGDDVSEGEDGVERTQKTGPWTHEPTTSASRLFLSSKAQLAS